MTPAISFRNVHKRFDEKSVLFGVDLEIPAGSIVGLLGTNGSGKTTLLKCALGLLRPQEGECRLLDEPAWSLSADAKRRIGYVPQVISLYPWMTTGELLNYTGSFYSNWNEARVHELREQFGMTDNARVGKLSVGQTQKLAIILALGHDPDLLILDEPAASLDPLARRQFLKLLAELAEPGRRTVLFSTHITSDLDRVADRVAVMQAGRVTYFGQTEDLKEQTHLNLEDAFLEMHHA